MTTMTAATIDEARAATGDATARLARRVARRRAYDDEVRERARLLLCDYLAVATRGAASESSAAAREALGGATMDGRAVVEGVTERARAEDAALLNAISAHSLELDDTHEPSSLHPGVVVWPTVLAMADDRGASADDALDAAIVGYDAICHVGEMLGGATAYARGFHPTGVCGVFGAAAAAGRLLGLDAEQMGWAFGIAGASASGSMQYLEDGAWTKRLNPGLAAANGIRAARLAAAGFRGPARALEGKHGFLTSYGGPDSLARAARDFEDGEGVRGTSIKLYPCCRYMHGSIDLLIDIAREHDLDPRDVEAIGCGVLTAGRALVADPPADKVEIKSTVDAQFSMPFGAAVAVAARGADLEDFERAVELAPRLSELMRKVECFSTEELDAAYPREWRAHVWVRTKDGTVLERRADAFRGSPRLPATWDDVIVKGSRLVGGATARRFVSDCQAVFGPSPLSECLRR